MIKADQYYINNLKRIKEEGSWDENPRPKYKDGTPAHSKFITQVFEEYDISKGEYPITTMRNTAIKMGIKEIFWIYQIQSNKLDDAHKLGINWWDEFNIGDGTIGFRYAHTIKKYKLIDKLLETLKYDKFSRRHIINMYQYIDLEGSPGLFPCAYETIWSVRKVNSEYYLDMTLVQRSNDYCVASYINKIQYVALMMMVAGHLGYNVGKFCHYTHNLHVYDRHMEALDELLSKKPLEQQPYIKLKEKKNFYEYTIDDFEIGNIDGIEKIKSELELAI